MCFLPAVLNSLFPLSGTAAVRPLKIFVSVRLTQYNVNSPLFYVQGSLGYGVNLVYNPFLLVVSSKLFL